MKILPTILQKEYLELRKLKKRDHFFQTRNHDLFCDDLYARTTRNHALHIYVKTMRQTPLKEK